MPCSTYICFMKFAVYSSRYFISIGLLMLACFTGTAIFISDKLGQQTDRISADVATKVYQLKSNIMKGEFNGFVGGIHQAGLIVDYTPSTSSLLKNKALLEAQLLNRPKVQHGWYAIRQNGKTSYQSFSKEKNSFYYSSTPGYLKSWADSLFQQQAKQFNSKLIKIADTLHWLASASYQLPDAAVVLLGMDINLRKLQHYLQSVDTIGRASAFIADEHGYYITGPEEQLIGTKIKESLNAHSGTTRLADSISTYEITNSSYLQVPVLRFYTPLSIAGMKWTMVIDTPLLTVDEDVKVIEKYVMILFILTAILILVLIAWFQAKWQKEFMLRQQAELKRKELVLEKQELNLVAERQQKENALLQLNSLKQKVNPHFLFNSLSSLNGLIARNPELAKSFVLKLSRVYRYVLESYPNGLASVEDELGFVREYFFLLKIRFGDALAPLEIAIPEEIQADSIPFMSLQTLIENAVKHNVLSKTRPLQITIQYLDDYIVVKNNLQLRNDVSDSGKQGLNYLRSTYAYFNNQELQCGISGDHYICYLPVLKLTEA